ncbi:hypothetical protein Taro_040705 [Colocasia esculenta]|uniref:Uncharacterized protein n=1 Tax=Colocasia esculenta TaxID=4460 RepID=A0A843WJG8_COLES|nr:hypothetical protein [Colocasia esculenta]
MVNNNITLFPRWVRPDAWVGLKWGTCKREGMLRIPRLLLRGAGQRPLFILCSAAAEPSTSALLSNGAVAAPPPQTHPPAPASPARSSAGGGSLLGPSAGALLLASWEPVDPFSLVADELSILANRLRSMVVAEVPKLASAAEYFFKMGVEGKRFRPTVLLLMASSLNVPLENSVADSVFHSLPKDMRAKQLSIAEITEMIHVASLLHDDVLDDAETRRGIGSLNFVMGNKVVSLLATVVEHLVTGETMQMTSTSEQRRSMEYYLQKTYYKTASLISNSCKAIALLAGQTAEVSMLAFEYGKNLGLAYQLIDDVLDFTGTSTSLGKGSLSDIRHGIITAPILFAMEEFPQLQKVVDRGFDDPGNVDIVSSYCSVFLTFENLIVLLF